MGLRTHPFHTLWKLWHAMNCALTVSNDIILVAVAVADFVNNSFSSLVMESNGTSNGQCLYATRRTHFGHRRWKKYVHWFRMQFQISLTSGKKCRSLQKVHSGDDDLSLPLAMVPNLCIDKKLGFDSPRCAVSFPRIGWIPSKNSSHPAMFKWYLHRTHSSSRFHLVEGAETVLANPCC